MICKTNRILQLPGEEAGRFSCKPKSYVQRASAGKPPVRPGMKIPATIADAFGISF
jgi:hypothetical protein